MTESPIRRFDGAALYGALDARRVESGLSWSGVARRLRELSSELNGRRHDHPISPSTLTRLATNPTTSCQHALFMLRWLNRTPESFLVGMTGGSHRLTGLRTARFATGMDLAMRIVQWLGRPAADLVYPAKW